MIYRITFGFAGMGVGWSETHAMLNAANDPKSLVPTLRDIAQKRAQFLGREFKIVAIRIARYANDAGVRQRGVFLHKEQFQTSVTGATGAAEPASVALLVRGAAEPSQINPQFNANTNQTFLGAPFDVSVDNGGVVDPGKGGLQAAFNSWRDVMLTATMGWLASDTIAQADIKTITQELDGTVTFETKAAINPALTANQLYRARIRQVNNGVSPLNGEVILVSVDATHVRTRYPIAFALAQQGGIIRFYRQVAPFIDYGDLSLVLLAAKHKRGRPFGSTPGRKRRRIRA